MDDLLAFDKATSLSAHPCQPFIDRLQAKACAHFSVPYNVDHPHNVVAKVVGAWRRCTAVEPYGPAVGVTNMTKTLPSTSHAQHARKEYDSGSIAGPLDDRKAEKDVAVVNKAERGKEFEELLCKMVQRSRLPTEHYQNRMMSQLRDKYDAVTIQLAQRAIDALEALSIEVLAFQYPMLEGMSDTMRRQRLMAIADYVGVAHAHAHDAKIQPVLVELKTVEDDEPPALSHLAQVCYQARLFENQIGVDFAPAAYLLHVQFKQARVRVFHVNTAVLGVALRESYETLRGIISGDDGPIVVDFIQQALDRAKNNPGTVIAGLLNFAKDKVHLTEKSWKDARARMAALQNYLSHNPPPPIPAAMNSELSKKLSITQTMWSRVLSAKPADNLPAECTLVSLIRETSGGLEVVIV